MLDFSEDTLVEQPAIELFEKLGWVTANCFHEFEQAGGSLLGRETKADVVLISQLRPVLQKLNQDLSPDAIHEAINNLTRDRSAMSPAHAKREVHHLIKDGQNSIYCDETSHMENDQQRAIICP